MSIINSEFNSRAYHQENTGMGQKRKPHVY